MTRAGERLILGEDRSLLDAAARVALGPAALLFRAGVIARAALYAGGALRSRRLPVPVISVGNLTVGGTGKTPLVIWVAERLADLGARPGVVLRGYGARRGAAPRLVSPTDPAPPGRESDEAVLLAARLPGVPVAAGRDRARGAALAIDAGARAIVLDDGFQHLGLARDLDLLLLDPRFPPPHDHLLPAGPFREPWSAARRADLYLVVDGASVPSPNGRPVIRGERRATALRRAGGARLDPASLAGRRVLLLSGIARPEGLRALVERLGASVASEARFPDHHLFRDDELESVARAAGAAASDLIVTTEKDAARLPSRFLARPEVAVLEITLAIVEGEEALVAALRRAVGADAG